MEQIMQVWVLEVEILTNYYGDIELIDLILMQPTVVNDPKPELLDVRPVRMIVHEPQRLKGLQEIPIVLAVGCLNRILMRYPTLRLISSSYLKEEIRKEDGGEEDVIIHHHYHYYLESA